MAAPQANLRSTRFPMRALVGGTILTTTLIIGGVWTIYELYADYRKLVTLELRIHTLAGEILHLDEVLTMSARMAAATGDRRWEKRYREHEAKLDAALGEVLAVDPEARAGASETDAANDALVDMENRAFAFVAAGKREAASKLLFSPEYDRYKAVYAAGMRDLTTAFIARADTALKARSERLKVKMAVGVVVVLLLGGVWYQIIRLIRRYIAARRSADLALEAANERLEARVRERTAELEKVNASLVREMDERGKMEVELRQAQKLESVGRLASGVAHEINTPIQFVSDNCHFIRDAITDLQELVGAQQKTFEALSAGSLSVPDACAAAKDAEEEADLEYLEEEVPVAIQRSLEGLDRVATIVRAMKSFAHPTEKTKKGSDLNAAISSTLTVARNEYKYFADVTTEFGELPLVPCLLGELNQAVLNIIVNAAQAIEDVVGKSGDKGSIVIRTFRDGNWAVVQVQDTGGGIPEDIRDQIFDPFFTTKEVGRGSGQGLAIARSVVVEQHGGELDVESTPGEGTTFTLRLPIEPMEEPSSEAA